MEESPQSRTTGRHAGRGTAAASVRGPALIAAGLWLLKAGAIATFPLRRLAMTAWVPDDAFIFMRIARNVALGRGYTFDGERLTSGAPQLWVWLTSLLHLLLDKDAAAKAVLVTSAFFGAVATVIVFWIADRIYGRTAAWVAFALTALGLPLVLNSMNGMDTSLFTCLGLLAIALYLRLRDSRATWRGYLVLGCVLGLLHLTRTDGIFLTAGILLAEVVRVMRLAPGGRREALREIAVLTLAVTVVTMPSLILAFKATGSPFPANQVGRRALAWEGPLGSDGRMSIMEYAAWSVFKTLSLQRLLSVATGSSVLAMLALLVGVWRGRGRLLGGIVLAYCGLFFGILVMYQWYFPDVHGLRYLNLPAHLFAVMTAGLLFAVVTRFIRTRPRRGLILIAAVLLTLTTTAFQYRELTSGIGGGIERRLVPTYSSAEEAQWWKLVDWMQTSLEPGTIVAATDHGRIAYYVDVSVIDLDGILLPELIQHLEHGSIAEFLDDAGVTYVLLPAARQEKRVCRCLLETDRVVPAGGAPTDTDRVICHWKACVDEDSSSPAT